MESDTPPGQPVLLALSGLNRNALVTTLTRGGVAAVGAREFREVVDRVEETGASAAIVDLRDDGQAALAAIRAVSARLPVLAIVPGRDLVWITAAVDAGAAAYLTSPFPPAELLQAARLVLRPAQAMLPPSDKSVLDGARASGEIARRVRSGPVSALLIAATRFASVNAAFGREVGDELLAAVAQRLSAAVRQVDPTALVARVGGAEFAVVVRAGQGEDMAEAVCARIDRPFMVAGQFVSIGCRIGVVDSAPGEEAVQLLRRASAALAEARTAETGSIFALGTTDPGDSDAALDAELRRALATDQIEVVFQPQIDMVTQRVVGVEALARWRHPTRGTLGASTLFDVAQRSDFLTTVSADIQARVLSAIARWTGRLATLRVAINLVAAEVAHENSAAELLNRARAAGVDPGRLTFEITESGLIENLELVARSFGQLRTAGARVAIDDFGTGYSSLAWLKALPVDYLKLDRRMTHDITGSDRDRIVVRSVIEMARSLGIAVVAEGVETPEQLELLAAEGCNFAQGYLFAHPLDEAGLAALLDA